MCPVGSRTHMDGVWYSNNKSNEWATRSDSVTRDMPLLETTAGYATCVSVQETFGSIVRTQYFGMNNISTDALSYEPNPRCYTSKCPVPFYLEYAAFYNYADDHVNDLSYDDASPRYNLSDISQRCCASDNCTLHCTTESPYVPLFILGLGALLVVVRVLPAMRRC